MGKFCVMRSCKHFSDAKLQSPVVCYRFPRENKLKEQWEGFVNLGNRTLHYKARTTHRVCLLHFESSCYNLDKLKTNAVPTIVTKFTAETALKCGLIPSLDSELLEKVNDFNISCEELYLMGAEVSVTEPTSSTIIAQGTRKVYARRIYPGIDESTEDSKQSEPHVLMIRVQDQAGDVQQTTSGVAETARTERSAEENLQSASNLCIARVESLSGQSCDDAGISSMINIENGESDIGRKDATWEVIKDEECPLDRLNSDDSLSQFPVDPLAIDCKGDVFVKSENYHQNSTSHVHVHKTSGDVAMSPDKLPSDTCSKCNVRRKARLSSTRILKSNNIAYRPRLRRKAFLGDLEEEDMATPEGRRLSLSVIKESVQRHRLRHKVTVQRLRRSLKKLKDLKLFLHSLIDKGMVSDEVNDLIQTRLKGLNPS